MKPTRNNPTRSLPSTTPPDLLRDARALHAWHVRLSSIGFTGAQANADTITAMIARIKLLEAAIASDGQSVAPMLKGAAPLMLYFKDADDRAALIVAAQLANPNLEASIVP